MNDSKIQTWGEGRMLVGVRKSTTNYTEYAYNVDGLRTQKTVVEGGISSVTQYIWGNNGLAAVITGDTTVVPIYDSDGEVVGFFVEETEEYTPAIQDVVTQKVYTYVKNLQGDVIRILDENGSTVVSYTYDPWGVPTVTGDADLAALNPCSYRGYDYDEETGYYYLQSRYYDPEVGRFLNADDVDYLAVTEIPVSNNLYAYCNNSPVTSYDPNGHLALAIAGATIYISIELVKVLLLSIGTLIFFITYRRQIERAITELVYELRSLEREISIAITAALMREDTPKTALHHIIAQNDRKASVSWYYWRERCGMSVNDPINLVRINQNFHYHLHTPQYHAGVASMVLIGWYTNKKVGVVAAVLAINAFLRAVNAQFF